MDQSRNSQEQKDIGEEHDKTRLTRFQLCTTIVARLRLNLLPNVEKQDFSFVHIVASEDTRTNRRA